MLKKIVAVTLVLVFLVALVGCESMSGEDKRTLYGAGAGATVGTLAALAFGQGASIAVAGGLGGALVGGLLGRYAFGKSEDHNKTAQDYHYNPTAGSLLEIEKVEINPVSVRPGNQVDIYVQYAFLTPTPGQEVNVTETREIYHEGRLVGKPTVTIPRSGGTYHSRVPLTLPNNALPGEYEVKVIIKAGEEVDVSRASFNVV